MAHREDASRELMKHIKKIQQCKEMLDNGDLEITDTFRCLRSDLQVLYDRVNKLL